MKNKIRLLIWSKDYGDNGGIARYLEGFLRNIPSNLEVTLLTAKRKEYPIQNEKFRLIPINYNENKIGKIIWAYKCKNIIDKLVKSKKIDIINLHIPPLLPTLFIDKKWPLLLTSHTTYKGETGEFFDKSEFKSKRNFFEKKIRFLIEKRAFKNSKKIIALTELGKKEITSYGINENNLYVFPNGVDINYFKSEKKLKDTDILFVGRLTPRKGSKALVELCKNLIKLNKTIKITIIGYDEDFDYVKNSLGGFRNIKILYKLPQNEIKDYYSSSKIYCSTSYYEGLPSTCLEAMSMGLPVVVWDKEFYNGLVNNNKEGLLIKTDYFVDMSNKLISLLKNKELSFKMGKLGRKKIIQKFYWKNIISDMLPVISKLKNEK